MLFEEARDLLERFLTLRHVRVAIPGAVRLALEDILMNELKHLLWELRRYS